MQSALGRCTSARAYQQLSQTLGRIYSTGEVRDLSEFMPLLGFVLILLLRVEVDL